MSLKSIEDIFSAFNQQKALIIGDVMIDSYLWGEVNRISPEAPVPVVSVKKREKRLGGAANVAMNVQALGAKPILCAVIGQDKAAQDFFDLLNHQSLSSEGIVQSENRITTVKHRILSGHQHMLRVDAEQSNPISDSDRERLWQRIQSLLPTSSVVIFEDYDKGVIDPILIEQIISLARSLEIPTVVDPKKRNFLHYEYATLFKPNLKELKEGLKLEFENKDLAALQNAVSILRDKLQLEQALVTLSEMGVYIDGKKGKHHIPAHLRSIADVSGAGDTVVSVAALCTSLKLSPKFTAALANLAGGLVCEYLGVVSVDKEKLLEEAIEKKLFDYDHE